MITVGTRAASMEAKPCVVRSPTVDRGYGSIFSDARNRRRSGVLKHIIWECGAELNPSPFWCLARITRA